MFCSYYSFMRGGGVNANVIDLNAGFQPAVNADKTPAKSRNPSTVALNAALKNGDELNLGSVLYQAINKNWSKTYGQDHLNPGSINLGDLPGILQIQEGNGSALPANINLKVDDQHQSFSLSSPVSAPDFILVPGVATFDGQIRADKIGNSIEIKTKINSIKGASINSESQFFHFADST
ncbi:hypothetical protein, partial [uncultured Sutterella sp.]|uniref:hypothetical protein n=1 Tax=uncultured Sutterella sp. TaxID=286133 RepID=UPI002602C351